jgi:TolB-like protein/tetratricopeptide (TPR) repeat protein
MRRLTTFLAELKRRRVYQVAVVYAAAAFVAAQAADLFLPHLGLPDWTVRLVVVLAVAGFPVALILAWVFDITPSGVRRTGPSPERATALPLGPWRVAGGIVAAVVVLAVGGWWLSSLAFRTSATIQSLAVLPFENLTGDPEQEYFVDGMHEALVAELSQISALRVISRTSVRSYRDTGKALPQIARELGVAGVIEGAVMREADRVRVSVRLLHSPSERLLWARSFDGELSGVLALHSEIAQSIADEVRITLTAEERARLMPTVDAGEQGRPRTDGLIELPRPRSIDPAAYELYLKGRYHWQMRAGTDLERSTFYFREAIARDPDWALPYAGLSDVYHRMGDSRWLPDDVAFPQAREAALAALERDPESAEAHLSLASVKFHWEWDWQGADVHYRRAIALNPNYSIALRWYSIFLQAMGRHEEAVEFAEKAFLLDPLDSLTRLAAPHALSTAGRHREAIERLERLAQHDPKESVFQRQLGLALLAAEEVERALPHVEAYAAGRPSARAELFLALAYARAGRLAQARAIAERPERHYPPRTLRSLDRAALYHGLGENERALQILEEGYAVRDSSIPNIGTSRRLAGLHAEPRFQALLQRLNFPGVTSPSS